MIAQDLVQQAIATYEDANTALKYMDYSHVEKIGFTLQGAGAQVHWAVKSVMMHEINVQKYIEFLNT